MKSSPIHLSNIRRHFDHLLAIFLFTLSFLFMYQTFWYQDQTFVIGSKVWSDFAAHIPLIRSFSVGENIPPVYPTFPGEPIRYHYLFYFLVGNLEKVGFNLVFALNFLSALGFTLLLMLIYKLTVLLSSSKTAGLLAILLFLFNGSLTWVEFFKVHPLSLATVQDILTNTTFASFGPWDGNIVSAFWNLNIYTNQRHLGLSFGLSLLVLYPVIWSLKHHRKIPFPWIAIGLFGMLLMPWLHKAATFMVLIVMGGLVVLNLRSYKQVLPYALLLILAVIPGLILTQVDGAFAIEPQVGFLAQKKDWLGILKYWFHNLGFYLLIFPLLFLKNGWLERSVLLASLPLFLIANLFKLSPDMINNHKLVNFWLILVVIITAKQLFQAVLHRRYLTPLLIIITLILTFGGVIDLFPIINDSFVRVDDIGKNPISAWIVTQTPPNSVFLTNNYLYHPALLAGRKTYLDYGYFNWSMGYRDSTRRELLPRFFSSSASQSEICGLLIQNGIDYIALSPSSDLGTLDPWQSTLARTFNPVFTNDQGYAIISTSQSCHNEFRYEP